MGALLIDSGGKGFTELNSLSVKDPRVSDPPKGHEISPHLSKLLDVLQESPEGGQPIEVMMLVKGRKEHAFTFVIKDPSELMEVLQWTIGRE